MIPLRDQELLRQRFMRELAGRVRVDYFTQRKSSVLIPGRQECALCEEGGVLLKEVTSLSDKLALTVHELADSESAAKDLGVDKVPGIVIRGQNNRPLRFFGLPSGAQFLVLIETIVEASTGRLSVQPETVKQLRRLKDDVRLQVLVSPACQFSPAVAHRAFNLGLLSARIKTDVIELTEFPASVARYRVLGTPTTIIGDSLSLTGAIDEATLVQSILKVAAGEPVASNPRAGNASPFNLQPPPADQQPQAQRTASGLYIPT